MANTVLCVAVNAGIKALVAQMGTKCFGVAVIHIRFLLVTMTMRTMQLRFG